MKIFQLFIIFFLINFSVKSQEKLHLNSTIKSVFNETEIQDLEIILDFFDEKICMTEQVDNLNILDCYQSFFERMEESQKTGIIEIKIPFDDQKNLYKQLSESTFNEIWSFGRSWKYENKEAIKSISFNYNGKYVKFLKELGNDELIIKRYYETFESTGDISPSMYANVLMGYRNYNIKDIRIRLFIVIHYLTLNDQEGRNEKY